MNANLNQDDTYIYELRNKNYKQLQALGKELREQGFYKGALNIKKDELVIYIAEAQRQLNAQLKERNEQQVFGNQSPRHRAGSVSNLMAGSKARAERENAGKQDIKTYKNGRAKAPQHKAANKAFAKAQAAPLSYGAPERKASANFAYKGMRLDLSFMTNGCTV